MNDRPEPVEDQATDSTETPRHIVAIGGSAGGLEAFEHFFAGMPSDTGMGFVVIQHLDPTHKAIMAELLQRSTAMPVHEVEDGMKVEPDHIYVIPPNTALSISGGYLHLDAPSERHGLRLPVDSFFQSFAADIGDKSIAVIVSGMGTDGTLGIKAIKEVSGVVMVQSPDSARFDGMPRSAIGTGLADYIAPIDHLPKELVAYVNHAPRLQHEISESEVEPHGSLRKILRYINVRTHHDFSLYKKSTLYRRIAKRATLLQIDGISEYVRYVEGNPEEVDVLFREMLIGVTRFFRDPDAFEYLAKGVIPDIVKGAEPESAIRVWVPGCSTGEEAYSIAILLRECVDNLRPTYGLRTQIFATDIDDRAIHAARRGQYPQNIAADVSPERLARFFTKVDGGYAVGKLIRDMVVFAPQNLTQDPPFTKMDLVSCRNLLIYFSLELQRKVLPIFHYALNPNGALFLGTAEGISGAEELFSTVDHKWKVYRRRESIARPELMDMPFRTPFIQTAQPVSPIREANTDIQDTLRRTLLEKYAPPSVVVNVDGDILLVSGRTGNYLEPAEGKANWKISAMAREGLRLELPSAIHRAHQSKSDVVLKGLNVRTNGDYQKVNVSISPLPQLDGAGGLLMVTFEDVPVVSDVGAKPSRGPGLRYAELERDLLYVRERLQSTQEDMDAAQKELKSANEELQSTNEELQSTNEELTTSKEELQSLNEELVTLNTELQSKVDALTTLNDDMVNLLNSTHIATLFLDNELRVKRFTPAVVGTFNLRSVDVGRPITDITQKLKYETMEQDVTSVLGTLATYERQVESDDGRWFIMRIMPYRTLANVIDGAVITFSDITQPKQLEAALLTSQSLSRALNVIHTEIGSSLDIDSVMRAVVTESAGAVGVELGMISTREDGQWVVRYVSDEQRLPSGLHFTAKQAPYHELISDTTKPIAIDDTGEDPRICSEVCETYGIRSILGIPLMAGKDLLGILSLVSTSKPITFTDADMDFAHKLGLAVSLALTNASLYESERQAKLDAEVARQMLEADHSMLQQALLPAEPHVTSGYRLATRFVPGAAGKTIGGDFFDIFETEDGKTAILIGDVMGKGVEAAALAAATRSTIRAFAYDLRNPGKALTHANAVICQSPRADRFATAFLAILDPATGRFSYSIAGHPPPIVRQADGAVAVVGEGQVPIGIVREAEYMVRESSLAPGEQLVMYTDGISEAHEGGRMFDIEGIKMTLGQCAGCSPDEVLEALFRAALDFDGGQLADDAAVVIIERE